MPRVSGYMRRKPHSTKKIRVKGYTRRANPRRKRGRRKKR